MQEKYNWSVEQTNQARTFIKSQFKNKIMRNSIKVKKESDE
jgi:hypothetical protein